MQAARVCHHAVQAATMVAAGNWESHAHGQDEE